VTSLRQTLSLFVATPPLFKALILLPRVLPWLWNLAWVRLFTLRPQRQSSTSRHMGDKSTSSESEMLGLNTSGFAYTAIHPQFGSFASELTITVEEPTDPPATRKVEQDNRQAEQNGTSRRQSRTSSSSISYHMVGERRATC
jgi:hypothetical protein